MKSIQAHRARLLPIVAAVGALYGLAGTDQASDTVTKGRTCIWPGAHSSSQR